MTLLLVINVLDDLIFICVFEKFHIDMYLPYLRVDNDPPCIMTPSPHFKAKKYLKSIAPCIILLHV